MSTKPSEYIKRAETWPKEAQEGAIAALQSIEVEVEEHPYEISDEDRQAIDRGLADAEAGRFVPEEEVARLLAGFRRA